MTWICPYCEAENPDRLKACEVCDSPREPSLKDKLKVKYNAAYSFFIRYQPALLESADKGDSKAQFQVAEWFLSHGNEDPSDVNNVLAVFWYLKAANNDFIEAQYKLALCYEEGHGVIRNLNEAKKWYEKAAILGSEKSKVKYLKIKYNTKTYESVIRYRASILFKADQGERYNQFLLGEWFNNHRSQSSYKEEAIVWYRKAAEAGLRESMYMLGECYEKKTFGESAIKWYKKAAKEGSSKSCMKLAQLYLYGNMVKKDVEEAIKWYNMIWQDISGGDLCNIGYAYDVGDTVPIDKFKAVEYYRKAAEKGDIVAHYNMGVCYENGAGVSQSIEMAKDWYKKASELGYSHAQQALDRINSTYNSNNRNDDGCLGVLLSIVLGIVLALILS